MNEVRCFFGSPESACSLEGVGSKILPLLACQLDMTTHLLSLGVSSESVSEVELIMNRARIVATEEQISMTICPKHRKKLTIDWTGRKSTTCAYPTHRGPKRNEKNVRRVNAVISAEIYDLHHVRVPIGSGMYICDGANSSLYFESCVKHFFSSQ